MVDYNLNANKTPDVIRMLKSSARLGAGAVYTAADTPHPRYIDAKASTIPAKEISWRV